MSRKKKDKDFKKSEKNLLNLGSINSNNNQETHGFISYNNSLKNKITFSAMSDEQRNLIKEIQKNIITFVHGCPGSGKTFIATLFGLTELLKGKYQKLILTRPCVEAYGENLGFLPGDQQDKIAPYMIPIFDILLDYMPQKEIERMISDRIIVTLPLAFYRGISLKNAFVIMDEAQNTIHQQVRMFLTRIGQNCKMVITGDVNQSDIRGPSGLQDAIERLKGVDNIGIVEMTKNSIVRHPIIEKIEEKYMEK